MNYAGFMQTAFLSLLLTGAALAKEEPKAPEMPGGDIFGFTSPTDVGNPGDRAVASENSGRFGKQFGSYSSLTSKLQFGITPFDNTAFAVSPFVTYHDISANTGLPLIGTRLNFDGLSVEGYRRIIERSVNQPFAVTIGAEPRWARIDGLSGEQVEAYALEAKLFIDAVVIPDTLFWAMNVNFAPAVQKSHETDAKWQRGSGATLSTALSYALSPTLLAGAELRYLTAFEGTFLNRKVGEALFFGPTLFWKLSDTMAFNAVWTPQIAGKSEGSSSSFDLNSFERHQFRVKLAVAF
jgi:hypothetical protein